MTNEELAKRVYGGQVEYIEPLYKQTYKIIAKYANAYYGRCSERLRACGVELADLEQEGYFALLDAVSAYMKAGTEYKLTAYLKYPLKNRFNTMACMRTATARREPLNNANNIDAPLNNSTEGLTLADKTEDKTLPTYDDITSALVMPGLFAAVREALTAHPKACDMLILRYKYDMAYKDIAERYRCNVDNVRQHIQKALRILGTSGKRHIMPYAECIGIADESMHRGTLSYFKSHHTSSVEWAILEIERRSESNNTGL